MYKIMVIEDDRTIATIIKEKLSKWGYETIIINQFDKVLDEFSRFLPQLVLLDINLPFYDGFYWCSRIRQLSSVPVIFISSRDTDADKICAITQGGDDYIEKPFSIDVLIAKVQAMLRRTYAYADQTLNLLQYKGMIFNLESATLLCQGKEISLTKNESRIITLLIREQNRIVSRVRIIKALWEDESFVDDNTLTVNINRLRRKLEEINCDGSIETIKGEGYMLS
ncbi:MAG: response regulator transcription factor [Clostridia bacterium]|nr:response regulator transcription factor [Clostridia bacterium]